MNLIGRFVFQQQVRPLCVVDTHRLSDHLSCLPDIFWPAEQVFRFEYPRLSVSVARPTRPSSNK